MLFRSPELPPPTPSKTSNVPPSDQLTEQINRTLREIDRIQNSRNLERSMKKRNPSEDIKVSRISTMESERSSGYVTYSIKADVDNSGETGEVFIKLIGKNRDGHQVDFVYLKGVLDRRESRTMTTTTMLNLQQSMDVRTWEVESINKYDR